MPVDFSFPESVRAPGPLFDQRTYVFAEIEWPKRPFSRPDGPELWQGFKVSSALYVQTYTPERLLDHWIATPYTRTPLLWDFENHPDLDFWRVMICVPELLRGPQDPRDPHYGGVIPPYKDYAKIEAFPEELSTMQAILGGLPGPTVCCRLSRTRRLGLPVDRSLPGRRARSSAAQECPSSPAISRLARAMLPAANQAKDCCVRGWLGGVKC